MRNKSLIILIFAIIFNGCATSGNHVHTVLQMYYGEPLEKENIAIIWSQYIRKIRSIDTNKVIAIDSSQIEYIELLPGSYEVSGRWFTFGGGKKIILSSGPERNVRGIGGYSYAKVRKVVYYEETPETSDSGEFKCTFYAKAGVYYEVGGFGSNKRVIEATMLNFKKKRWRRSIREKISEENRKKEEAKKKKEHLKKEKEERLKKEKEERLKKEKEIKKSRCDTYARNLKANLEKAEAGDVDAQFILGIMHDKGEGVEKDYKKAIKWYQKAATQGHVGAHYYLGFMYNLGNGVTVDRKKAAKLFHKAAEQDHADAQYNLGFMYALGKGVTVDRKKAAKLFHKAAEQDHASAKVSFEEYKDYIK